MHRSRFRGCYWDLCTSALPRAEYRRRIGSRPGATSQQGLGQTKISNATVRMIARVTVPGDAVRIRLDNTFGKEPRDIGARDHRARAFAAPAVAAG